MDGSLPGSSVHGILQARILEWGQALLQGILPTQGSKLCLLRLQQWHADSLSVAPPGNLWSTESFLPIVFPKIRTLDCSHK